MSKNRYHDRYNKAEKQWVIWMNLIGHFEEMPKSQNECDWNCNLTQLKCVWKFEWISLWINFVRYFFHYSNYVVMKTKQWEHSFYFTTTIFTEKSTIAFVWCDQKLQIVLRKSQLVFLINSIDWRRYLLTQPKTLIVEPKAGF